MKTKEELYSAAKVMGDVSPTQEANQDRKIMAIGIMTRKVTLERTVGRARKKFLNKF